MKYMKLSIMALLIFGVATSPAFSNGLAFADEHPDPCTEEKRQSEAGCEKTEKESKKVQKESRKVQKESKKSQKVKYDCTVENPAPQCG